MDATLEVTFEFPTAEAAETFASDYEDVCAMRTDGTATGARRVVVFDEIPSDLLDDVTADALALGGRRS